MKETNLTSYLPLAPLVSGTEEDRGAYLLYILCWVWTIVVTAVVGSMLFVLPAYLWRCVQTIVSVDVTIIICLLLNRKGYFKPAAILFVMAFWLIASLLALTAGGVNSVAVVAYLPIIVATGLLLGGGWGVVMAVLSMLTVLLLVVMENNNLLPAREIIHSPFTRWMGYAISGMLVAFMQYIANRRTGFAFEALKQEIDERKKTEEKLRESEFNNQMVIDNKILGIGWASAEGKVLNASDTFCRMLGYTTEELKGVYFGDFTHPDDTAKEVRLMNNMLAGTTDNYTIEKRYRHKNGDFFWVELCLTCHRHPETGAINFFIGLVQNIQQRKNAEAEQRKSDAKYRSLIEQASDPIMVTDLQGNFLDANATMCNMFGYTKEELLQSNIGQLIDAGQLKQEPVRFDLLAQGIPVMRERRMKHKNGTIVEVESNAKLTPDGTILAIARNITERAEARRVINAMNESLEKKVMERTAELQEANKELQAFNYSVSHDLQSPLRIVSGFVKILVKDYGNVLNEDGRHLLQTINGNVLRMNQLVRDLLEFSKSGRAVIAKEAVDMNTIVNVVIDEVKMGREDFATEIILHPLSTSTSDANLIKQVWANLIFNAVKFSGKKERPVVEIGNQVNNGEVIYYVKDNGAGFDMQNASKLFTAFQRMHHHSDFEGTGVGLATTHRIVTRHGGKIWAEAKPDEGATFYFTIPLQ